VESPRPEAAQEAPRLAPGDLVGRFELLRELGRGGFGVVFEARDRELGRLVALKSIRQGRREGAPAREASLRREAEAVASLHHPNIVTLYDFGRAASGPYLVLELLQGEPLSRRMERGPLPLEEALEVAVDVARALVHAHARGVLHRDLKPGNVALCGGTAKVLDFGIARVFGRAGLERSGTPGYMAPEQLEGSEEDERTDVHALAQLIREMLTGQAPAAQAPGPAPLGRGVPPALARLLERAQERDRTRRPDAAAFLEALLALQRERRVRRLAARLARHSSWVAALLVAGLVLAWKASSLVIHFDKLTPQQVLAARALPGGVAQAGLPPPEEVAFQSEGITLRGWLFRPGEPAGCGVVFHHGKASTRHGMLRQASALWPRGCHLLLFDARDHGLSDHAPVTFGVHEKIDLLAAVNLLAEASGVPRSRIGLFGASLGASIALQTAVLAPDLAFVMTDTPFADFRSAARNETRFLYGPWLVPFASPAVTLAGWRGAFDPADVSPVNEVARIRIPTLILHARRDERIPWQDAQRLYDRLTTPHRSLRLLDWASGHCRAELDDPARYRAELDAFLDEHVPGFGRSPAPAAR